MLDRLQIMMESLNGLTSLAILLGKVEVSFSITAIQLNRPLIASDSFIIISQSITQTKME